MSAGALAAPDLDREAEILVARADLLYCLARAFLPPPTDWSICDWGQLLVDDLSELGLQLGLDTVDTRQAIAVECARWSAAARAGDCVADGWLVEYSRLFLVPPVAVTLNTGVYLEGSLGGSSTQMVRSCYETAGVVPDERFHDLPDHVAMELEFVARLLERSAQGDADGVAMAEEFCAEFVHAWAEPLEQACRKAAQRLPAALVYVALARLLRHAVADPSL